MDEPKDVDRGGTPVPVPPPGGAGSMSEGGDTMGQEPAGDAADDISGVSYGTEAEVDDIAGIDDVDEKKPPNKWKWAALGLLFALLAGVIVLIVLTRSDTVEIPDVKDLTLESATKALESVGLNVGVVEYTTEAGSEVLPGTVVSQSPEAGSEVESGSDVDLVIAEPMEVEVPNVVGQDVVEATEALEKLGLEVATKEVEQVGAPAGSVVDQSPTAGTKVEPGATVTLTTALGRDEAEVPDVVGSTQQAATSKLENAGFSVSVEEVYDSQADKGIVIGQTPKAGVTAAVGEVVTIVVSLGANPEVTVPDVVGETEANAVKKLRDNGLEAVPSDAYSSTVAAGSIISQNPAGGTKVQQGSLVAIVVSLGAEPPSTATVPDVLGKSESEATSTLEGAGYVVAAAEVYSDSVASGTVGWQIPVGGSVTEPGITVGIIVSAGPRPPEFTIVPDVRDMTLVDATQALEDVGLEVFSLEIYTELAPTGQVAAQVPAPDSAVAPGSTIVLIVSKGAVSIEPH